MQNDDAGDETTRTGEQSPAPAGVGFLQGGPLLRLSTLPRAWSAAFSRGASYEELPPGRNVAPTEVRGYYVDFSSKTASPVPESQLLPAALAQLGLGFWERSLDGDPHAADQALRICERLSAGAREADDGLRWIYDVAVPKYGIAQPFTSALAQGQIASLLVRAHLATGNPAYAANALRAVEPMLSPRTNDLVSITPAGPILEEIPSRPRSHVLNGWISALWGLLDVAAGLGDDRARDAYDRGIACLDALLPRYDTGWWTRYSLYPWTMPDLAKPIYHRFHCSQLEVLGRLTPRDAFTAAAARWHRYDTTAGRARLLAQKSVFVVRHSRGRLELGAPLVDVEP
jgi:heparosan-N-sulfate-glucuronate 5-epimerase